jgi:hypothetical protein
LGRRGASAEREGENEAMCSVGRASCPGQYILGLNLRPKWMCLDTFRQPLAELYPASH